MGPIGPQHRAPRARLDLPTLLGVSAAAGIDLIVALLSFAGVSGPAWGTGLLLLGNIMALWSLA